MPQDQLIVRGAREAFAPWHATLDGMYLPATMTLFIPEGAKQLPPVLAKPVGTPVNAWLCEGLTCLPAITSPAQLRDSLELPTMRAFASA